MMAVELFVWGFVIHIVADWLLQNDWMANHKASLRHPASWIHSGIHLAGLLLVFHPVSAGIISVLHLLIDTRTPLQWWRSFYRQTQEGDMALHVALWGDQVAHIAVLAIVALAQVRFLS